MSLKDALQAHSDPPGRRARCRICVLLEELPVEDASALDEFLSPTRNLGPKPIADALAAEGYGDLYHSVKQHKYVCLARS